MPQGASGASFSSVRQQCVERLRIGGGERYACRQVPGGHRRTYRGDIGLGPESVDGRTVSCSRPLVSGPDCLVGVAGSRRLMSWGFEGQAASQPQEFPGHHFELFHQGPGLFETALSRGGKRGRH